MAKTAFETYFELAPEPYLITDSTGMILHANRAAQSLLLCHQEDLEGHLLFDFVLEKERKYFRNQLEKLLEKDRLASWELTLAPKEDKPVPVEINSVVVFLEKEEQVAILWLMRDTTERRRIEQVQQAVTKMEAASAVAGEIAHDFNDLMVSVLGNTELLQMQSDSFSSRRGVLDDICQSARNAVELAQKMLSFARGGRMRTEACSMNDIVKEVLLAYRDSISSRVAIEERLENDLWEIEADKIQMNRLIRMLLENITEQPGDENRRLTILTENVSVDENLARKFSGLTPDDYVCLTIEDTGMNLNTDVVTKVFEPYFSNKPEGKHAGLSSAYTIVKNHKGQIFAYSDDDHGATFRVYFPARKESAVEKKPSNLSVPSGEETILIIDDEEMVLKALRRILSSLGYRILVARNGLEATEVAQTHTDDIHLALLDLGMPVMGGVEAFPLLQKAKPDMKVLICSGYELDTASQKLLDLGACGFIQKPFELQTLAREIRSVLDS